MPRTNTLILKDEREGPLPLLYIQAAHEVLHIKLRNIRRGAISWLSSTYQPL